MDHVTHPRTPKRSIGRLRRDWRPLAAPGAVDACERELGVIRDRRSPAD